MSLPDLMSTTVSWHAMSDIPAVQPGDMTKFLLCWRVKATGEVSSSECLYLNAYQLFFDEPPAGHEHQSSGWYICTGWYDRVETGDGGTLFEPLSEQFVEHLGWTEMPVMDLTCWIDRGAGQVEGAAHG